MRFWTFQPPNSSGRELFIFSLYLFFPGFLNFLHHLRRYFYLMLEIESFFPERLFFGEATITYPPSATPFPEFLLESTLKDRFDGFIHGNIHSFGFAGNNASPDSTGVLPYHIRLFFFCSLQQPVRSFLLPPILHRNPGQ